MKPEATPHIAVFSSLFPSERQPGAGLFVRERMFRVARRLPLCVVSPVPWFPLQGVLRRWRPGFRPGAARFERQDGIDVWYPRFLSIPGLFKGLDGVFMALGALPRLWRLKRAGRLDIIDAHFAYPDGYAASLVGRWLGVPVTITLRGTEPRHARQPALCARLMRGLRSARRVFSVSQSLRQAVLELGLAPASVRVIGNGVDLQRFTPLPKAESRLALGLPLSSPVLVTVGGLVERKGFHRVIECLPELLESHPGLVYLVIGGPNPEGDVSAELNRLAGAPGLQGVVRFLGPLPPDRLRVPLSAADVFVLATRNEGWANVLLEAMACGLPVVATDVGGNAEVVASSGLGTLVPFGDPAKLKGAIDSALQTPWDRAAIRRHAESNTWEQRVDVLEAEFRAIHQQTPRGAQRAATVSGA